MGDYVEFSFEGRRKKLINFAQTEHFFKSADRENN